MKGKYKKNRERKQEIVGSSKTVEGNGQTDAKQNDSYNENPGRGADVPIVTKAMPSKLNAEKTEQCHYKSTPRWKTTLEVMAVVFGIGYAVVTGLQWWDLRQNFKIDQRPWIGLTDEAVVVTPDKIDAEIKFVNSGKTPARNVQKSAQIKISPVPLIKDPSAEDIQNLVFSGHTVLAPNGTVRVRAGTETQEIESAPILKEAVKNYFPLIDAKKDILYLFGEVIYDDASGKRHTTKYCLYAVKLETGWHLAECDGFNEMD